MSRKMWPDVRLHRNVERVGVSIRIFLALVDFDGKGCQQGGRRILHE